MDNPSPHPYITKLEIEIQNFIGKYGADELIKWLHEYSKIVSQSDFNMFHRIQKFTCEVYNIPVADINKTNSTNAGHANAKRIITFLTFKKTRLQQKHLTMLQGCTTRTIYNHCSDVDFRIRHPEGFRDFIKKYESILQKITNYECNN